VSTRAIRKNGNITFAFQRKEGKVMLDLNPLLIFLNKLKVDAEVREVGKILLSTVMQFSILKEMIIEICGEEGEAFEAEFCRRFQERIKKAAVYQQATSGLSWN
jgi:hypothetical protein